MVYHYTSAEGLRGIVGNSEIWLTNAAFVNDTTECRAFWDLTRDQALGSGPFANEHVQEQWESSKTHRWEDNDYYIASFSRAPDLLEQWRAYGSFCIGFDASKLIKTEFHLYDCVYDAPAIKEWIRQKSSIGQWNGNCLDDQAKRAGASNLLFAASMKYKNAHYEAEKEVRLISVSTHNMSRGGYPLWIFEKEPPIHFRDHRTYGLPVPYVKFFLTANPEGDNRSNVPNGESPTKMRTRKLEQERIQSKVLLPVTEVRVGPMMCQREAKVACEILLQASGYENVAVNASDIPYRGS
ncbi:MAG: DUF2971 domain-containing protein [Sedimentisphaerales bacterium]|nr:DUF2971 domain-containing protein [Sedimentisphaerales bacterium]